MTEGESEPTDTTEIRSTPPAGPPCASCGAPYEPGTKYCTACGAPRPGTPPRGGETVTPLGGGGAPPAPEPYRPRPYQPPPPAVAAPPPERDSHGGGFPIWLGVVLIACLCAGGGVAAALLVTKHPHTVTAVKAAQSSTQPQPTSSPSVSTPTTTPTTDGGDGQAVLDAVNSHWAAIRAHDFTTAYGYLDPNTAGDETTWVNSHEQDGINDVHYDFGVAGVNGDSATVDINTLQTFANADMSSTNQNGCVNWTGTYGMTRENGRWVISSPNIQSGSC